MDSLPNLNGYLLLAVGAPPLKKEDNAHGLLILDGTWRYAEKMMKMVDSHVQIERRSLPAYSNPPIPRRQEDCPDPERGLASIEAIYLAYCILGRDPSGLLNHYYWKDQFLTELSIYMH